MKKFLLRLIIRLYLIALIALFGTGLLFRWAGGRVVEEPQFPRIKEVIVHKAVVNIGNYCSGVIIKKNLIATAAHCIRGQKRAKIIFYNQDKAYADVLYVGKPGRRDFAFLQVDTLNLPYIPLATKQPYPLTLIKHLGYSGTKAQWATPGIALIPILTMRGLGFLAAIQIIPGDSGGAIVDWYGKRVYGIGYASYWPIKVGLAMYAPAYLIREKLKELRL